jgi:pimeloyl-ACP methyl ester carboxylesterase
MVAGAGDLVTTREVLQALARRIEGARFVEIADAIHLPNIQQTEKVNRFLLSTSSTPTVDTKRRVSRLR